MRRCAKKLKVLDVFAYFINNLARRGLQKITGSRATSLFKSILKR
jgi:hypothetical protein